MAILCPSCGEEITYLRKYEKWEKKSTICLDDDGDEILEDFVDEYEVEEELDYECPHCDEAIFHTAEEAENFLRGKHELYTDSVVEEA